MRFPRVKAEGQSFYHCVSRGDGNTRRHVDSRRCANFRAHNSSGTPLTIVDLMRAATWSPDFDLIDSIDGLLDELSGKGFGGIDRKVVLRNLSASAGGGFSVESIDSLRGYSPDHLKAAVAVTEEAYRRAVDFLVTQIRVESAEVLPLRISSPCSQRSSGCCLVQILISTTRSQDGFGKLRFQVISAVGIRATWRTTNRLSRFRDR